MFIQIATAVLIAMIAGTVLVVAAMVLWNRQKVAAAVGVAPKEIYDSMVCAAIVAVVFLGLLLL